MVADSSEIVLSSRPGLVRTLVLGDLRGVSRGQTGSGWASVCAANLLGCAYSAIVPKNTSASSVFTGDLDLISRLSPRGVGGTSYLTPFLLSHSVSVSD